MHTYLFTNRHTRVNLVSLWAGSFLPSSSWLVFHHGVYGVTQIDTIVGTVLYCGASGPTRTARGGSEGWRRQSGRPLVGALNHTEPHRTEPKGAKERRGAKLSVIQNDHPQKENTHPRPLIFKLLSAVYNTRLSAVISNSVSLHNVRLPLHLYKTTFVEMCSRERCEKEKRFWAVLQYSEGCLPAGKKTRIVPRDSYHCRIAA